MPHLAIVFTAKFAKALLELLKPTSIKRSQFSIVGADLIKANRTRDDLLYKKRTKLNSQVRFNSCS